MEGAGHRLLRALRRGEDVQLSAEGRGASFTTSAPAASSTWCAAGRRLNPGTAEVLEDGLLFELGKQDADALMGLCPVFTRAIATMLAGRMRHLAYAVGEQSLKHVSARLAQLLLDLADREGERGGGGVLLPRLSQEEIASLVGTVRECVSRALSDLRERGIVRTEGRRIVVLNRRALAELSA